jgi:zinc/manganese transport system ATP-binding protein
MSVEAVQDRVARDTDDLVYLRDVAVRLGGHTIWSGANLTLKVGTITAVLGPNGAGKSTLLRLLLGLIPSAAGTCSVLGKPPRRGNGAIGYVPQRRSIDPDLPVRGLDLVLMGTSGARWGFGLPGRARMERMRLAREAIDAVGATEQAGRRIGRLSGGEQQRLLMAQALVNQPRLLFLDEPLTSLDIRNQVAVSQMVTKIARERNIGVLMVTHDINPILSVVDQVVYVAHGKVAVGQPRDIITTEALSRLYEAPVEVVTDTQGRIFVVGLEGETAHPHDHTEAGHAT